MKKKSSYRVLGQIRDNVESYRKSADVFYTIRWFAHASMLRCSCGGALQYRAVDELRPDPKWGGCSHLVAITHGRVTEQRTESERTYEAAGAVGSFAAVRPYVELNYDGRAFFGWRWAAIAMEVKTT